MNWDQVIGFCVFLSKLLLTIVIEQGSCFLGTAVLLTAGGYDGDLLM